VFNSILFLEMHVFLYRGTVVIGYALVDGNKHLIDDPISVVRWNHPNARFSPAILRRDFMEQEERSLYQSPSIQCLFYDVLKNV
jgi:hypothetical protein